ncbi:nucleotide-binding domain-containing protein [Paraburkholderia sp. RL17-373-BIF-A]|uniref:nucleotide-binding domain-containing protein n=1 Tax=Paraburkholderia sp. RL17-373-BIF-A TaxID=3031629 RepID=UPI0038B98236
MYDTSKELAVFYENHVRLGTQLRNALGSYRDINLQRLTSGLTSLGNKNGVVYKTFVDSRNQGSYAMHTLNQSEHIDYDIDVAVIFEADDLPDRPGDARARVCEALLEKCSNFTKEPETRKNAVTVWYAEGYHIDFAVYRRRTNWLGSLVIEHAGGDEWTERDPMAYPNWFTNQVDSKSPPTLLETFIGTQVSVARGQLRRIVRFVKAFARSRSGWALPGGIIITSLVCEVYKPNATRDDVALFDTLKALYERLCVSAEVQNPISPGSTFTSSDRRRREVERLRDVLAERLPRLNVLHQWTCTPAQAYAAWDAIFFNSFWSGARKAIAQTAAATGLTIECMLARKKEGKTYKQHVSGSAALPKGVHLRFTANSLGVALPYSVRWSVRNEGDEAKEENQLTHDKLLASGEAYWTYTAFKGEHKMICEIVKNGETVRHAEHIVRIAPGRRYWL